ncbi:ribonuclease HI family protein [Tuwongella immobilis]|uniref:RNase H type-1 domain-containing protein n=1 Tax=Tuwongella immobilis TaxID=692036 RepID=A0A6C2YLI2_9BACT|nr:ribonuclease HI family protein [Tuwongella immobilis]VIP01983.1 ribonuclease h : Ribonuclease H OS=Thermosediminibacter oceani (strain ATCC BAA-1034 / DSM 16646 / JW/IW-1228P) GN=Toce_0936 PE=4 SV=1: RVT_3 [Tuwongella immobilis]VTS00036.1 ribonuclease h : Ribonuclease H OS=Thermosediminibacter oceani (strain ATCC BAA-1034 / DSM 16646 / JW/IW-1228P) GN=Toce_0936 PE=4 SV=1: RVT_3 [Tuwongella immobilis]
MANETVTIHIDGASRGNPGPAAYAYVIAAPGQPVYEAGIVMPKTTNNIAEYTALVEVLGKAAELGLDHLLIHSDSELMVKQMAGEYRVKNEDLKELYDEAVDIKRQFSDVRIVHVRREQNRRADELCNLALDGKPVAPGPRVESATPAEKRSKSASAGSATSKSATKSAATASDAAVREDAIAHLEAAAKAWARDGVAAVSPEMIWDQLWDLLVEAKLLKTKK